MKLLTFKDFLIFSLFLSCVISNKTVQQKDPKNKILKLSQVLAEQNPMTSLRKSEFIKIIPYALYKLTRGELEQIFYFADLNHDDLLDHIEWDKFVTFYLADFEKCDTSGNYILDRDEFKKCFRNDPKTLLIHISKEDDNEFEATIRQLVSTRKNRQINFSDYLFIRRALFAWQQCQSSSKYIARSHFKCAYQLAIPQKYYLSIDYDILYNTGLRLTNNPVLTKLNFIAYLRTLYASYVFAIFAMPHNFAYLEKTQFLKAVKEDRFPSFFNENEIHVLYSLIHNKDQMDFETFAFFQSLNKLFHKYSEERPQRLSEEEVMKLLNDTLIPASVVWAIDACETKFNRKEFREASLYLQTNIVAQESDFYYSFKQPQIVTARKLFHYPPFPRGNPDLNNQTVNAGARETFFRVMLNVDKQYWDKKIYYTAFQLANLFVSLTKDQRYFISVSNLLRYLPQTYDKISPSINSIQRHNLIFYKSLPHEIYIDLITFLEIENYMNKFMSTKISQINEIPETLLKVGMKDYGMSDFPDDVIDIARTGYDKLKRRVYNLEKVMHVLMTVQSVAAERRRFQAMRKVSKIKEDKQPGREYPTLRRRRNKGQAQIGGSVLAKI